MARDNAAEPSEGALRIAQKLVVADPSRSVDDMLKVTLRRAIGAQRKISAEREDFATRMARAAAPNADTAELFALFNDHWHEFEKLHERWVRADRLVSDYYNVLRDEFPGDNYEFGCMSDQALFRFDGKLRSRGRSAEVLI